MEQPTPAPPESFARSTWNPTLVMLVAVVIPAAVVSYYEIAGAMCFPGWFYLANGGAVSLVLAWAFRAAPSRGNLLVWGLFLGFLALLHLLPTTPRKPFLQAIARIEVGMTAQQVHTIMADYPADDASPLEPPPPPGAESIVMPSGDGQQLWFRHSTTGPLATDTARVTLREGRVVGVSFLPGG